MLNSFVFTTTRDNNKLLEALDEVDEEDYWIWSWDDLVVHDLTIVINLVYKQTGQKIHYVGHSLGTLTTLASFSEGRQIDKIISIALLNLIAYLSHMTTPLGVVAARSFLGENPPTLHRKFEVHESFLEFELKDYAHADFIVGTTANDIVFN
ncbi:hypothetical protein HAX54_032082 [Datura stramonium]|uniref:Triacylglycerol lipase n=1 Tax=Datura stramonium TaxID=4076 RepID=A0ABS8VBJ8_DATST|nr:hypothetical protein [Datura stramonium]